MTAEAVLESVRVLVVEDFAPFRRFVCAKLEENPALQVICEVSDGLEAVRKAEELQPDLILLDVGLPTLNGIDAARQIHKLASHRNTLRESRIFSRHSAGSPQFGALGYVVKTRVAIDLLPAIEAVRQGRQFVSGRGLSGDPSLVTKKPEVTCRHEAQFYTDDASFLDGFTLFIGAVSRLGMRLLSSRLSHTGTTFFRDCWDTAWDIAAAIEQGRYISLDAADTLSTFMVNDLPDPARFLETAANLITAAAKTAKGEHSGSQSAESVTLPLGR